MVRIAETLREVVSVAAYPALGHRWHRRGWDAADLDVDLAGQVHVVTGGTAGVGLGIARGLAKLGATVIAVGRDRVRGARACREIRGRVELELADLSDPPAVRALAARILARHAKVHALVNNAGAIFWQRRVTSGGLEATFAVNVLAGFLLGHLLAPALARAAPARMIHVTSAAIYGQRLDVDGLLGRAEPYRGSLQYARTKRAQVELSAIFGERLAALGVTSNCMHPGLTATDGTSESFPLYHRLFGPVLRDPDQGADTAVWLAASKAARGRSGELFFDRAPRPLHVVPWTESPRSEAERLWAACATLGGLSPDSFEVQR